MDFDEVFLSDKKKKVYSDSVCNCEGCLLPRDIEREVGTFGFPTKLTYDEVAFLAEDLTNINTLDDYSVEESEWFGLETLNGHSFHWMRKKDVTLYVNAGNTQWDKLSIHYLNGYVSNDEADKMKITIILQGEERIEIVCELGESTANIDLPDDLNLTGLVKIDISVDKLWKPIDINKESSDDRLLGIGLFSIGLI